MKKLIVLAVFIAIFSFIWINVEPVFAQTPQTKSGLSKSKLTNPLGDKATPQVVIGRVIKAVLGLVGSLALLMFIYGGLTWMTSGGNDQSVAKGQKILMWATIGLIIVFSAYALVIFVLKDALGVSI